MKDDGQDVVADVTLALQLLWVVLDVRQQSGHVEDDFATAEGLVEGVLTGLTVLRIETTSVPLMVRESDDLTEQLHELLHCWRVCPVTKECFLADLAKLLVDQSEFESCDQ